MSRRAIIPNGVKKKTKYVIPNAITASSLVLGLVSIFYSYHGNFKTAAWVILYSTILDKLDGSMARALKASSTFGTEFDSFSDFVAFGLAPAALVFSICAADPNIKAAWMSAETPFFLYFSVIFFILASAMRLARFNITSVPGSRFMQGMATTVAGGIVSSGVLVCYNHLEYSFVARILERLPYLLVFLGALELSTLPIQKIGYRRTLFGKLFETGGFAIAAVLIIFKACPEFLFVVGTGSVTVGFIRGFFQRRELLEEASNGEEREGETDEDEEGATAGRA